MKRKAHKVRSKSDSQFIACAVVYALTNVFLSVLEGRVYWQVLNIDLWGKIRILLSFLWLLAVVVIVGKNPVPVCRQRGLFLIFSGLLMFSVLQFPKYTYRQAADLLAVQEKIAAEPLNLTNVHYYAHLEKDPKNPDLTRLLYYDYIFAFDDGTGRTFCFDPNTGEYTLISNEWNGEAIYPMQS